MAIATKEFEYCGMWVRIEVRHPTTSDGQGLYLADVEFTGQRPGTPRRVWARFDRGLQAASVDPDRAIRDAAGEICTYIDKLNKSARKV